MLCAQPIYKSIGIEETFKRSVDFASLALLPSYLTQYASPITHSPSFVLFLNPILQHLVEERFSADLQSLGGFRSVPVDLIEGVEDDLTLSLFA